MASTNLPDTLRLSLLDRSRTRLGEPHAAARATLRRAERAGRWASTGSGWPSTLGAGIASGSPPVLIAAAAERAAHPSEVGGVMVPNHRPMVIAEQFAMLGRCAGRIDLGVGRSLGFPRRVPAALGCRGVATTPSPAISARFWIPSRAWSVSACGHRRAAGVRAGDGPGLIAARRVARRRRGSRLLADPAPLGAMRGFSSVPRRSPMWR